MNANYMLAWICSNKRKAEKISNDTPSDGRNTAFIENLNGTSESYMLSKRQEIKFV